MTIMNRWSVLSLVVILAAKTHRTAAFIPIGKLQLYSQFREDVKSNTGTKQDSALFSMKRPLLDRIASTLFELENKRVQESSELDSKGRYGEPMEWSESSSLANKVSRVIASNSLGYQFKQFVADITAGEYDEASVKNYIGSVVDSNRVAMFSFTSCPFCRRAKDYLDDNGIAYTAVELDELEGNRGNEIRAMLGKITRRTSVPSIFVNGNYIGGCNDGPGLFPLVESGEFKTLLMQKK